MQQQITLQLTPSEAANNTTIVEYIAAQLAVLPQQITGFYKLKESIDARSRHQIWINITLKVFVDEPFFNREAKNINYTQLAANAKLVIIIGAGPAGLFAALKFIELGIKPIVLERGKNVRDRRRDLATLNKTGVVNPESNYCFGEGGAGTYSDGKLYTRSNKRGNIDNILNCFVQFGADEKILYQAHPHIGTNKLPHIIEAMRNCIIEHGGEVHFDTKVSNFIIENDIIKTVQCSNGNSFTGEAIVLATGHSARDIFELLQYKKIYIEAKPFALGVRVEHPQHIIDSCQYHSTTRSAFLPPASYSLVQQVGGKGVFSFCMCPGGIIAAAATAANEVVVNGWSPSKRNNPYANSGIVVSIEIEDVIKYNSSNKKNSAINPLSLLQFQQHVEQQAYKIGTGNLVAPAQRLIDFCEKKLSPTLPKCSYIPGVNSSMLNQVLPPFVHSKLQQGFIEFGKKMKGYYTNEAIVVATESRTSSPVKIPRYADNLQHVQIKNLYPCGEGAGYAGGIVSAAIDGEKVAIMIAQQI